MLRITSFMCILLIGFNPVQASLPVDDIRIEMRSVAPPIVGSGSVSLPERNLKPKVLYLRRSIPFLFSGAAAVAELTLVNDRTNPVILAATVLWLGANVVGLGNLYLDYRIG